MFNSQPESPSPTSNYLGESDLRRVRVDDVPLARGLREGVDATTIPRVKAQVLGALREETGVLVSGLAGDPTPEVAVASTVAARDVDLAVGRHGALHALDADAVSPGALGGSTTHLKAASGRVKRVLNKADWAGRVGLVLADHELVLRASAVQRDVREAEGEVRRPLIPPVLLALISMASRRMIVNVGGH